jgi:hypothetical protein
MSRRQHHAHGHGPHGSRHDAGRGQRPARRPFETPVDAEIRPAQTVAQAASIEPEAPRQPGPDTPVASPAPFRPPIAAASAHPVGWPTDRPVFVEPAPSSSSSPPLNGDGGAPGDGARNGDAAAAGATAPQFRRFIKSRAYVPMHELRRRFGINGMEDDVTPVELDRGFIYVGLPAREGRLLGELLRGGEVGYELSLDPCTPIVIGVYPMRPVPRH